MTRTGSVRLLTLLAIPPLLALTGCGPGTPTPLQGYAEAEYRYLASPVAGSLQQLNVKRGESVSVGTTLFALDPAPESDDVARLEAQHNQQQALVANLRAGQRPDEVAVLRAQAEQAKAQLSLSQAQWQRAKKLAEQKLASTDQLDAARTQLDRDLARDQEASARLRVARLGARSDEIRAAEAQAAAIDAQLAQARWKLAQKSLSAPVAGRIQDTLFEPGEYISAGQPVIVLLPADALKVRFYVPQALRSKLSPGSKVKLHCDGCAADIDAEVRFVSDQIEYTPPVLFNRDNRAELVFRAEAWPLKENSELHPGQPVDVLWQ
ncbi:HlyD family efflux transporter periplasmic adaptor subunit [Permianibacter sp. IMCC34836]|uniref:HlyD family secretion protein n=1 Tax=Permianibacter fluminis TaxID=2738515 RepID=UPI0015574503|nr:HlyD family efflux transporter periplasmic adaptor subunit [Permianibacter fluminis]NQD38791.1 HlyD family efflux transporter periplasmic adaptor subunit [Permianibacter fluminis]